jgi:predicted ester cyclase
MSRRVGCAEGGLSAKAADEERRDLASMSITANKATAVRFITEVWNAGDIGVADEVINHEYVVPGTGHGAEAVKRNVTIFREASPDLVWTIEDVIGEGDRVAMRLTLHGTHLGVFRGIAPTGRSVTIQEMVFWRLVDGQLHTGWFQADTLGICTQLGALPPM